MESPALDRILIANRGVLARHLIRVLADEGFETVSVFHEPDVEQPWVDEADYAVYLNGATVAETYLHPQRVISACMDAGCDGVHPGSGYLAEDLDFHDAAVRANMLVLGTDASLLQRVHDRFALFKRVRGESIGTIPCSADIGDGADPDRILNTAASLGYPLRVRAVRSRVARRVDSSDGLLGAVDAVRDEGERLARDRAVYLEGLPNGLRTISSILVADQHGSLVHLGLYEDALGLHGQWWMAEMGPGVVGEGLSEQLADYVRTIGDLVEWTGIGTVDFAVTPSGGAWFAGLRPSLPAPHRLPEALLGVDLVRTQIRLAQGDHLGWEHHDVALDRHALVIRLLHGDPATGERPEGVLERLDLPEQGEAGVAVGQPCSPETDPVLAEYLVVAPNRHAALIQAREALQQTAVEGVPTNREALIALLEHPEVWEGRYDVHTVQRMLSDRG